MKKLKLIFQYIDEDKVVVHYVNIKKEKQESNRLIVDGVDQDGQNISICLNDEHKMKGNDVSGIDVWCWCWSIHYINDDEESHGVTTAYFV